MCLVIPKTAPPLIYLSYIDSSSSSGGSSNSSDREMLATCLEVAVAGGVGMRGKWVGAVHVFSHRCNQHGVKQEIYQQQHRIIFNDKSNAKVIVVVFSGTKTKRCKRGSIFTATDFWQTSKETRTETRTTKNATTREINFRELKSNKKARV